MASKQYCIFDLVSKICTCQVGGFPSQGFPPIMTLAVVEALPGNPCQCLLLRCVLLLRLKPNILLNQTEI